MTKYVEELIAIIRGNLSREELIDRLFDYHDNDIAEALELLTPEERKRLYSALGAERVAEIFAYLDDGDIYLKELSLKQQAKVISEMDSDDAVDILEEVDDDTFSSTPTPEERRTVTHLIRKAKVEETADGFTVDATMLYGDSVYWAKIAVKKDGMIEIVEDDKKAENMPIRPIYLE